MRYKALFLKLFVTVYLKYITETLEVCNDCSN